MGSKKRSPQHPASPAGGEVGAQTAGKAAPVTAAPESPPVSVVPRPPDVAPFLTKVYDMVSDPATDAVISWTATGGSFVIWDSHAFERDLLPRHFKHNHFTSFIRQLNTYGFHKVDPDRWEWANEGFVKGQKHLLKTIKRKKKSSHDVPSDLQPVPIKTAPGTENIEIGKYGGLEKEVETLKRDKALLMQQLVDLRQYQQSSSLEVQNLIQRLRVMEQNQQQMMALLAIVVQNPDFLNQLVQQQRRSNWWNDDGNRKRRFQALEHGPVDDQETSGGGVQIIQYRPVPETSNQPIPANEAFYSTHAQPVSSPAQPVSSPTQPVSSPAQPVSSPAQPVSSPAQPVSSLAQPVSSPALEMPMDVEMTSNNVDTLDSTGNDFTDTSALCEWDDMDIFGDDLEHILQLPEQDFQVDPPLTVEDYGYDRPRLEQDCQMEAQQDCKNPQYADVITKA